MFQERRKDFAKRAEYSEDIFRTMFKIASVGMAVTATDGRRLLDVNEKFCEITGYKRDELIGMRTTELTHPDDRTTDEANYARAASSQSSQHLTEKRYLRKDGAVVWVRVNAAYLRDPSGKAFRTLAVVEDITARVYAETALRESERRLTAFLDGIPDRARLKDADGRYIAANLSEARALGVSSVSELVGKTLADFRPQEQASAVAAEESELIASGKTLRIERQARDGTWMEMIKAPIQDGGGGIGGLVTIARDVTERKRVENELRESEHRLREFLDGIPDRAWYKDTQGRYIFMNAREAEVFGVEAASLIGKSSIDVMQPDQAARAMEEDRQVIAEGKTLHLVRRSNITGNWSELVKAPVRRIDGTVVGVVGILRDITESKKAEEALRDSERKLRALLDAIPDCAWLRNAEGRFVAVNRSFAEELGLTVDEIVGKTADEVVFPGMLSIVREEERQLAAASGPIRFERVFGKDKKWFEIIKSSIRDVAGNSLGVVAIARDISERRKADQALRDSERQMRALLDSIPDRAWLKDAQGRYVAANRSALEFFGLTQDEVVGKTQDDLYPPDLLAQVLEEEARILSTLKPIRVERQFGKQGRWYETIKTPIVTADGKADGLVAISRDVTERKQAEDELRAAKAAAEAANRAKGEFLSHMSHEMRTPMNAILGFAELALLEQPDANQCEHLAKITAASKSLLRVIDDVLDFERVDAGKLQLESIDFRLGDVLQNVRDVVERAADSKGLALRFKVGEDVPPRLKGDPSRIAQVLMNLCANAVKFTSNGYVEVVARTEKSGNGNGILLHIEVRDTGIGISTDEQARLFQPFSQADSSTTRRYGGTGLGLVICRRLVELMGGRIWIDSEPGEGTTVSFTIACSTSGQSAPAASQGREQLPAEAAALLGKRVLVVDDHPINRMLMAKLLKLAGAEAVPAENGLDALRVLEQEPHMDLVLMDLRMPEMDGYEATRKIRADERWRKLPIVAVTASAATYERARCMAAGMNDVMVKPIHQAVFFPVIAAVMKRDEGK